MTWLISLMRNRSIDRLRQSRETTGDETDWGQIVNERVTPSEVADMGQEHQHLESCIHKLEDRQRGVIVKAFYTGVTYAELVARLSVLVSTMESRMRRSLLQLKTYLEQQS